MKLYKTILLIALSLATAFATAQTPARKLLLIFAIDTPAATSPAEVQAAFEQNSIILQHRAKALGVKQVQIWQPRPGQIGIALPDSVEAQSAKALLGENTLLTFHLVDDDPAKNLEAKKRGKIPGYLLLPDRADNMILVRQKFLLDSHAIAKAEAGVDQNGSPTINIELDRMAEKAFAQITKDNFGRRIAVVLTYNGKQSVLTAPVIRSVIDGGRIQILGGMSTQEAAAIAHALNGGVYPQPMRFVSSSYGPVPADAISTGPTTQND